MVYMAVFYVFAGVMHFVTPNAYLKIMPPFIAMPLFMVRVSGMAEIALGLLLLHPDFRIVAAWGIIGLLVAIFPANIYHLTSTLRKYKFGTIITSKKRKFMLSLLVLRLPLQFLLIYWAWMFT